MLLGFYNKLVRAGVVENVEPDSISDAEKIRIARVQAGRLGGEETKRLVREFQKDVGEEAADIIVAGAVRLLDEGKKDTEEFTDLHSGARILANWARFSRDRANGSAEFTKMRKDYDAVTSPEQRKLDNTEALNAHGEPSCVVSVCVCVPVGVCVCVCVCVCVLLLSFAPH